MSSAYHAVPRANRGHGRAAVRPGVERGRAIGGTSPARAPTSAGRASAAPARQSAFGTPGPAGTTMRDGPTDGRSPPPRRPAPDGGGGRHGHGGVGAQAAPAAPGARPAGRRPTAAAATAATPTPGPWFDMNVATGSVSFWEPATMPVGDAAHQGGGRDPGRHGHRGDPLAARPPPASSRPASLTKVLTSLVALENFSPGEEVTITPAALGQAADDTVMGLQAGETLTVQELLDGMLLPSGDDAASAIAVDTVGEFRFVSAMNAQVAALGLQDFELLEHLRARRPRALLVRVRPGGDRDLHVRPLPPLRPDRGHPEHGAARHPGAPRLPPRQPRRSCSRTTPPPSASSRDGPATPGPA